MAKMEQVTLHGMWASPFYNRVQLALKLKGIPYNSVEEDLVNKSQELLQYNPIYKKIPVLLHNGKPIVESLIILEYIEDAWKDTPLMPQDPYLRSKARFWYQYFEQTVSPSLRELVFAAGESREKSLQVFSEKVKVLEEGLEKDFGLGGTPYVHGEQPGLVDVAVGMMACYMTAFEEVTQEKLIDPEKNSTFFNWTCALKDHPVVKEVLPDQDRLVAFLKQATARMQANAPKA